MSKERQKNSTVKESSLLEEAMDIEVLGLQSLSKIRGGINLYIEERCKDDDKRYADCSKICNPYDHIGCGS